MPRAAPGKTRRDEPGEALQLAQVRPALARAGAVGPAAEEVGARAHEVVPVVAVGPQPDAERVVRDDRPGRAERERRAEAPGLHAHEVDRQRAAQRARQPRPEAAAAHGHALGRDPPAVGARSAGSPRRRDAPRSRARRTTSRAPSRSAACAKPSATNSGSHTPFVGS